MKNIATIVMMAAVLSLASPAGVSAAPAASGPKSPAVGKQGTPQNQQQAPNQNRAEVKKSRIVALANGASVSLTVRAANLEKIASNIAVRIDKIKNAGGNTTEAEALVVAARGKIAEAKAAIETLKNTSSKVTVTNMEKKEVKTAMKKSVSDAAAKLKAAHDDLKAAVASLKNPNSNASTTRTN